MAALLSVQMWAVLVICEGELRRMSQSVAIANSSV